VRWFFFPYEAVGARGGGGDVAARPLDRTRVMRTRRGDDQSHEDDANRGVSWNDHSPWPAQYCTKTLRRSRIL